MLLKSPGLLAITGVQAIKGRMLTLGCGETGAECCVVMSLGVQNDPYKFFFSVVSVIGAIKPV